MFFYHYCRVAAMKNKRSGRSTLSLSFALSGKLMKKYPSCVPLILFLPKQVQEKMTGKILELRH